MNPFRTHFIRQGFLESDGLLRQPLYQSDFSKNYQSIRNAEGRSYSDEEVGRLPDMSRGHRHEGEWRIRKTSAERLIKYLQQARPQSVLEVGCGNGWLIHQVAKRTGAFGCGMDVVEEDLRQAVRVFGQSHNLTYVLADIQSPAVQGLRVDQIVMAGSLQYFNDLSVVLGNLLGLLTPRGELHLLDSPIYRSSEVPDARERSRHYFQQIGYPEMIPHYHHADWAALNEFRCTVAYNPLGLVSRLRRRLFHASPFPWVIIKGRR